VKRSSRVGGVRRAMVGWKGRERRKGYDGKAGRCEMSEWPESLVRASHPFPLSLSSSFCPFLLALASTSYLLPPIPLVVSHGRMPERNQSLHLLLAASHIRVRFSHAFLPLTCLARALLQSAVVQHSARSKRRVKVEGRLRGKSEEEKCRT